MAPDCTVDAVWRPAGADAGEDADADAAATVCGERLP